MEVVSGQTGITVSCILHIIKNNYDLNAKKIIIIIQTLNVIDKIIIFIYSWLIFHGT